MLKYAVVEISGRQYLVKPDVQIEVDYIGENPDLNCDKVLLKVSETSMEVGSPYLKESLEFKVQKTIKSPKIRVATYKAKANTRRVKGSRQKKSVIALAPPDGVLA